jgi:hypothetical protein
VARVALAGRGRAVVHAEQTARKTMYSATSVSRRRPVTSSTTSVGRDAHPACSGRRRLRAATGAKQAPDLRFLAIGSYSIAEFAGSRNE